MVNGALTRGRRKSPTAISATGEDVAGWGDEIGLVWANGGWLSGRPIIREGVNLRLND